MHEVNADERHLRASRFLNQNVAPVEGSETRLAVKAFKEVVERLKRKHGIVLATVRAVVVVVRAENFALSDR